MGDGTEEMGLFAAFNQAFYSEYNYFKSGGKSLDRAQSLTLAFTVKFDKIDTVDCTQIDV